MFAVPGSPLDPRSEGANALIRNGATLITCAADIIEGISPFTAKAAFERGVEEPAETAVFVQPSEADRSRLTEALGAAPVAVDELIAHTGLSAQKTLLLLLELDLAGRLERHSGGRVSLIFLDP